MPLSRELNNALANYICTSLRWLTEDSAEEATGNQET